MAYWTVNRTEAFLNCLKKHKHHHELFQELDKKIQKLQEDPVSVGGLLAGKLHRIRSTRLAGKYRLLFQIDEKQKTVYLIALDHRGEVYN